MKFKAKTKGCHLVIRAKAAIGENVDEKELDRFLRIYLRGFLKPKVIKKNQIEYTGPIGITLYERLKKPLSKRDFLFIMEQLVVAVQKMYVNNMPLNHLIMDIQNVYINEVTKEVQFIYLPLMISKNKTNLIDFIETMIYSVNPEDEKDKDFVSRFVYFFKGLKQFDINKLEDYIAHEDRSVVNTIKKQNAGQSGFMTNKQHYYDHYDQKSEDADDDLTDILTEEGEEATGLLEEDEATGLLYEEDEATGLLEEATGLTSDESNDEEVTGLLIENNASVKFPTLFRILTNETIIVNKPVYRIGKERSYVDYFVTNNIAVSRSHADIITRGSKFFIKDLNSKNHTYINDQELPIMFEVEIHDGDRLKLGNEEFVFNV